MLASSRAWLRESLDDKESPLGLFSKKRKKKKKKAQAQSTARQRFPQIRAWKRKINVDKKTGILKARTRHFGLEAREDLPLPAGVRAVRYPAVAFEHDEQIR